jgi:mono/diheme cytochrome c family protein
MALRWIVATVASAALIGTVSAQEAPNGDASRGARLFRADGCWECHGTGGQGGGAAGPRIADTALPYIAFVHQLRTPMSEMPPFEARVLSDVDAADIYAFLKTLPKPRPFKDIPELSR